LTHLRHAARKDDAAQQRPLLDHLVGRGEQRFRDGEAEGFGGLEVVNHLKFCDLLHGEIGRLVAFENAPGIEANLVVGIADAAAIANQATGQGVLTVCEDRGPVHGGPSVPRVRRLGGAPRLSCSSPGPLGYSGRVS
jgi:hypothetical protein